MFDLYRIVGACVLTQGRVQDLRALELVYKASRSQQGYLPARFPIQAAYLYTYLATYLHLPAPLPSCQPAHTFSPSSPSPSVSCSSPLPHSSPLFPSPSLAPLYSTSSTPVPPPSVPPSTPSAYTFTHLLFSIVLRSRWY